MSKFIKINSANVWSHWHSSMIAIAIERKFVGTQARQLADANNTFVAYHTRSTLACALRQNRVKYTLDCTCEKPRSASVALLYPIRALLSAQMPDAAILIARDGCISNHKFHASSKTSRRALQITPDKIATRTRLQRNVRRDKCLLSPWMVIGAFGHLS